MTTNCIKSDLDNGVYYFAKFPDWVRDIYYKSLKGKCQLCNKPMTFEEMEVHRIKSGQEGGFYTLCKLDSKFQNCKFLHKECHKLLESNKRTHISHHY